jgi:hypothetical protein
LRCDAFEVFGAEFHVRRKIIWKKSFANIIVCAYL